MAIRLIITLRRPKQLLNTPSPFSPSSKPTLKTFDKDRSFHNPKNSNKYLKFKFAATKFIITKNTHTHTFPTLTAVIIISLKGRTIFKDIKELHVSKGRPLRSPAVAQNGVTTPQNGSWNSVRLINFQGPFNVATLIR